MASLNFKIAKRQKLEAKVPAFSETESEDAVPATTDEELDERASLLQVKAHFFCFRVCNRTICSGPYMLTLVFYWWQKEGNQYAEAGQHSAAIRCYDRALELKPASAALHELKAQASALLI